ncbi:Flp family type IVb pilin [Aeromicrobium sp.]|uniref:Flp family type IVb pilin n=1 Tax=Aeromicrobium sp. TaxID=1871063 RepID=UPI002FC9416E
MIKFLEFYLALTSPPKKDERGATATEYGLLVTLIAIALIVGVGAFGGALNDFFQAIANTVNGWATN